MGNYVDDVEDEEGTSENDGVSLPADKLLFKVSFRGLWIMIWMCSNLAIEMSERGYSFGIYWSPLTNFVNVTEEQMRRIAVFGAIFTI